MANTLKDCSVCGAEDTVWIGENNLPNQCSVCSEIFMYEFQTKVNSGIKIISISYDMYGTLFKLEDETSYRVWGCDWFKNLDHISEESEEESEHNSEDYSEESESE